MKTTPSLLRLVILLVLSCLAPHVGATAYHAELGRRLQRDPLGYLDGANTYEYVAGMPIAAIDPMELQMSKNLNHNSRISPPENGWPWDVSPLPWHLNPFGPDIGPCDNEETSQQCSEFCNRNWGDGVTWPLPSKHCCVCTKKIENKYPDESHYILNMISHCVAVHEEVHMEQDYAAWEKHCPMNADGNGFDDCMECEAYAAGVACFDEALNSLPPGVNPRNLEKERDDENWYMLELCAKCPCSML